MIPSQTSVMKAFRGEATDRAPFWEVWFGMKELAARLVGSPVDTPAKQVSLARILGWETLKITHVGPSLPHRTQEASDGTRHYAGGGLRNPSQLQEVPPLDVDSLARQTEHAVHVAHDAGLASVMYFSWCFHAVVTAMGLANFCYALVDDRGLIEEAMDLVEERSRKVIRDVVIPCGVDFVLFDGDCAYKNALMVNPKVFREFVFDRTKQTVALLKQAGIPYTFHSDGKVDDFAPVLIELEFSAMHGVEAAANDLADIKARFGKEIALVGNMDCDFLSRATPEDVRRATEEMLKTGLVGGRYIAACNTSPLDYIPDENYLAMVDVIKNFSRCG